MTSEILESWYANAQSWNKALENGELLSRELVTNQAILDAVTGLQPKNILDAGCGEGWLCRKLKSLGIDVAGFDGSPQLIELAKQKDAEGNYKCLSFEQFISNPTVFEAKFDLAVLNFCLYEKALTNHLLTCLSKLIKHDGHLVIQTLHPCFMADANTLYQSGWRQENWAGLSRSFTHPYHWYFRTLADWIDLINNSGWRLVCIKEPLHPVKKIPASVLFIAQL